jgi:hypothetical protein
MCAPFSGWRNLSARKIHFAVEIVCEAVANDAGGPLGQSNNIHLAVSNESVDGCDVNINILGANLLFQQSAS